jgi:hypothetical protein
MPIPNKTAQTIGSAFKMAGLSFPPEDKKLLMMAIEKNSRSQAHAQLVVDTWIERSREWPKPSDIAQLCAELDDPDNLAKQARQACEWCNGDGWREVQGPYGLTAAYPCDHKGSGPGNLGVKLSPAENTRYREGAIRADAAGEEWRKSPVNPMNRAYVPPIRSNAELRRVTAKDVAEITGVSASEAFPE